MEGERRGRGALLREGTETASATPAGRCRSAGGGRTDGIAGLVPSADARRPCATGCPACSLPACGRSGPPVHNRTGSQYWASW